MKCIHSDWIYTGKRFGTLYSCVVPDSANLIGRLSAVVRHCASHSTAALIGRAGIKAALGYSIMACGGSKGTCPSARRGALAVLRTKLYGVRERAALETVTRKAAAFLGVDDCLGTLDKGKWASFIAWNGDPFDLASRPLAVYAEGQAVFQEEDRRP